MPFVNIYAPYSARLSSVVAGTLEFQIANIVGKAVAPFAEAMNIQLGPKDVTCYFFWEEERPSTMHGNKLRDIWGEVCTGMIPMMPDAAIREMCEKVAESISFATGQQHFVEILPRALDGKNGGRRKALTPKVSK